MYFVLIYSLYRPTPFKILSIMSLSCQAHLPGHSYAALASEDATSFLLVVILVYFYTPRPRSRSCDPVVTDQVSRSHKKLSRLFLLSFLLFVFDQILYFWPFCAYQDYFAQLGFRVFKENNLTGNLLRTIYWEDRQSKTSSTQQDSNPWPPYYDVWPLLLGFILYTFCEQT